MNYSEFKEEFPEDLLRVLQASKHNVNIKKRFGSKEINSTRDYVVVTESGCIGVNINVEEIFESMTTDGVLDNKDYLKVLYESAMKYINAFETKPDINVKELLDYSNVKDKLLCQLIPVNGNEAYLERTAHVNFLDMAVIFKVIINEDENSRAMIAVSKALLQKYSKTEEQIFEDALQSHLRNDRYTPVIDSIENLISGLDTELGAELQNLRNSSDEHSLMYILHNKCGYYGTSAILDKNTLRNLAEYFEDSFYILLSSQHEAMCYPKSNDIPLQRYKDMLQEGNGMLEKNMYLSDSVYFYDKDTDTIAIEGE